jgi:30S ribosomal protein 3
MLPMAVHPTTTPALVARPRFPALRPSTSLSAASSSCTRTVSFKSRRPLRSLAAAAEADAVKAEESFVGNGEEVAEDGGEEVMAF